MEATLDTAKLGLELGVIEVKVLGPASVEQPIMGRMTFAS